uniref:DM2 domain-containing protein n=1 Tax=Zea mays TaxID=4577 RepID=A0A804P531_MAIZE
MTRMEEAIPAKRASVDAIATTACPRLSPVMRTLCGVTTPTQGRDAWPHSTNPAKKTEINCDATLKSLFGGRDKVGMLEINRLLNAHFPKN